MTIKFYTLALGINISVLSNLNSQRLDYGLMLIWNSSAQTNYDPTIPEDGTFQWNALATWGGGVFALKELSNKFSTQLSLNYQQKGYKELAQVGYIPGGPIYDENLRNTFNYLNADAAIHYQLTHSNSLNASINLGLEYSYLLDYNIESDHVPINMYYPVKSYQDQWEKHNMSIVPSLSLTFEQIISFDFGFNRSLTPVLETDDLVVKDWIWTLRANVFISRFINPGG